ncbi:MAG: hypothetical protein QMO91_01370 [Candidatus Tisiphia sp.]|nr:hypothetical protein [Candidatus Tisiphia sp.]
MAYRLVPNVITIKASAINLFSLLKLIIKLLLYRLITASFWLLINNIPATIG